MTMFRNESECRITTSVIYVFKLNKIYQPIHHKKEAACSGNRNKRGNSAHEYYYKFRISVTDTKRTDSKSKILKPHQYCARLPRVYAFCIALTVCADVPFFIAYVACCKRKLRSLLFLIGERVRIGWKYQSESRYYCGIFSTFGQSASL